MFLLFYYPLKYLAFLTYQLKKFFISHMKNNSIHITLAMILVALLVALSDPFMVWMPPVATMLALLGVTVLVCGWAGFVMKEQAEDEREELHRTLAGRVAYLSGIAVLLVALITQGFSGHIDTWIAVALAVMILSKLFARIYFSRYK